MNSTTWVECSLEEPPALGQKDHEIALKGHARTVGKRTKSAAASLCAEQRGLEVVILGICPDWFSQKDVAVRQDRSGTAADLL